MMRKNALMLKKYGLNPHFKLYTKKQIKKMIKTNPDKLVNLFFTTKKYYIKLLKINYCLGVISHHEIIHLLN